MNENSCDLSIRGRSRISSPVVLTQPQPQKVQNHLSVFLENWDFLPGSVKLHMSNFVVAPTVDMIINWQLFTRRKKSRETHDFLLPAATSCHFVSSHVKSQQFVVSDVSFSQCLVLQLSRGRVTLKCQRAKPGDKVARDRSRSPTRTSLTCESEQSTEYPKNQHRESAGGGPPHG